MLFRSTQKDPERTAYNGATIDTYQKLVDLEGNVVEERKLYTSKYAVRNAVVWFNPADLELWGIDPFTGIRTEPTPGPEGPTEGGQPTVSPGPEGSPAPTESLDPQAPVPPPEVGDDPVLPPVETQTPPPAAETLTPADLPLIPPPGTITAGQ